MRATFPRPLDIKIRWAVLSVALLSVSGAAIVSVTTGPPRPGVADEFCYLLAGDTFSRLRLTNPTHPLWKHFEAFHLFHEPTYSAKYPPGQGLVLAVGYWLGHPAIGVWLSAAAMSAAVTWMLWAWLPPGWALFAGLLAALKFGISGTWAQSYIGGAVVVTGGALLYGGLRRLLDQPRVRHALWIGAGLVILANSRPFEGMVFSLPAAGLLLVWLLRRQELSLRRKLRVAVLPIGLVLAAGAVWTLTHNRAVTGDPLRLPYLVHQETYPFVSLFVWQKAPQGTPYRHWVFREFEKRHRWSLMQGNPPGIRWRAIKKRYALLRETYLPGLLWVPLLFLPLALRDRWTLLAVSICVFLLSAQLLTVPVLPHYSAAATCFLFFLIAQSVRGLSGIPKLGKRLVPIAAAGTAVLFAANTVTQARADNRGSWVQIHLARPAIEARLSDMEGNHVVIVRYGGHHNVHSEWVYNSAEIDSQRVIWAHDRGDVLNRRLMAYFDNRRVWLLHIGFDPEPDMDPPLEPYRPSDHPSIGETELADVLEMTRRTREPEVRQAVLNAILENQAAHRRTIVPDSAYAVGLRYDRWTRGNLPSAIALRNGLSTTAVPVIRLACQATGDDLPVTVTVDGGRRSRQFVFDRPGHKTVRLRKLPAGGRRLVMLWTDKSWQPRGRDRRWLGVKIESVTLEPADVR